jgi:conjugal transfer/type IV secretion protein DotA/TraY
VFFEDVTKKQVLKYIFLPEVAPRIREFIVSGFSNLASFMALVYRAVHLLPENHPYLKPGATGSFTVGQVITEASKNLQFDVKHMDQIIIFFSLIAGIIILAVQFVLLLAAILINPASAGQTTSMPANYGEFFITQNREEDIALRLLDSVFGIEGFFGSKEPVGTTFHQALHGLLQIYSIGLLVIAAMIIIYFIFAILAETAQTGTPFGKRYNHAWAPIRLVAAIGLLIPIGSGLNSAQWITLYAAKFGSGFATTGWVKFNETMRDETLIEKDKLIAEPNVPAMKDLMAFMMMAHACKYAYEVAENKAKIDGYIIYPDETKEPDLLNIYVGGNSVSALNEIIKNAKGQDIKVRFGEKDPVYGEYASSVYPYCGDLVVSNSIPVPEGEEPKIEGANVVAIRYLVLVARAWEQSNDQYANDIREAGHNMMKKRLKHEGGKDPEPKMKGEVIARAKEFIAHGLRTASKDLLEEFKKDEDYKKYGWGGAGIWYNKIADVNGRLVNYVYSKPQIKAYPYVMEYVCDENQQQNKNTSPDECYDPQLSKGKKIQYIAANSEAIAAAMSDVYKYWHEDSDDVTGNSFIDTINLLLGTEALFDMCKNADIHPLAQLSSVGKGLVEAAIRNLGYAIGTGVGSILPYFGPALGAASSFFSTIASIGLLIGFILYYIVPFMPFLYFLFAVGGWVKGIFEAMVGVPLWALAHIRIDGEGLPGDNAINGYFLIFEIFIRPILIVFGMLASILIFGAMVKVLNEVFHLVVSNLSGFDTVNAQNSCGKNAPDVDTGSTPGSIEYFRGPVDEFFFTVMYAILVYMIGMSCFKLIDLIPNKILRWMGAGVPTFSDQAGEPAEGLIQKMAVGGTLLSSQLGGITGGAKGALGKIKDGLSAR